MHDNRHSFERPSVQSGQIWLIEQISAAPLSPVDRDALAGANVVIYDRALETLVARVLPVGAYAEPLSRGAAAEGPAISPRAVEFAAGGWSVVQLVEARSGGHERMRAAAGALTPLDGEAELSVRVIAKNGGRRGRNREARLPELAEVIGEFADDDALTLVFGPLAARRPASAHAFTANGLAG